MVPLSFNTEVFMADQRITDTGYDQEDAYFHQKDAELLARRRAALDAQRKNAAVGTLKCPRCGSEMNEIDIEQVKVDRCTGCGGVFLDKGELELLTHAKFGGFFKRLFG
jgi:Zn-finger nucleic acid-binding protein